jgi:hypothetical protein
MNHSRHQINRVAATDVMESASLRVLQEYILSGRRDQAIDYLNSTMNVQRERAAGIVDQALILSGSP